MNYKAPIRAIKKLIKSQKKSEKIINITSKILPQVACIDIGASYYPHPAWEVFRRSSLTNWIAVEPNHENLEYVKTWTYPSKVNVVAAGLSEIGGKQTLFKTNMDSGSSLLKPVIPLGEEYRYDHSYFFPVQEIKIETITLNEVVNSKANNQFLAIKLDTQGTELSIIKGLSADIFKDKIICVDIEVTLRAVPAMVGSARFYEVQKYLEDAGMELVRLKPIEGQTPKYKGNLPSFSTLQECDAVFLLRPEVAHKRGEECLRALLGFYVAYQLYGEANEILNQLDKTKAEHQSLKELLL